MSRMYETTVTLTVDGDETDCTVRAHVDVEPGLAMGGGWGAQLDGDAEAFVGGKWTDVAVFGASAVEIVAEALCDVALNDDSSADAEDWERDCA